MRYNLVISGHADDFTRIVQSYLDKGWQLYGDTHVGDGVYCQAVVKHDGKLRGVALAALHE